MRNNPIAYLVVTLFILAIDWYVFQAVKTTTRDFSATTRRALEITYWLITGLTLASIYATFVVNVEHWPKAFRAYLFGTILVIYAGKLFALFFLFIDDLVRLFRWIASKVTSSPAAEGAQNIARSKFLSQMALFIGAVPVVAGLYGMIMNAYNYQFKRVKVPIAGLPPEFEGLKIIQLSDIHSGSFNQMEPIIDVVSKINKEQPDLIFFTGDIVNSLATELEPYLDVFKQLKAKQGVYSVFGNHDYGDYHRWDSKEAKYKNQEDLRNHHKYMGWRLLWDEHEVLERNGARLAIIGVQNWSAKNSFKTYGNLSKAYTGCEDCQVKLLLSHDPSHWDAEITEQYQDIDITFSGHTHGAQLGVEIPGYKWSPSQYIYKQWAGLYQKGKQYIYVNRGFGFIGFPGRVGILPEVTVMELTKA